MFIPRRGNSGGAGAGRGGAGGGGRLPQQQQQPLPRGRGTTAGSWASSSSSSSSGKGKGRELDSPFGSGGGGGYGAFLAQQQTQQQTQKRATLIAEPQNPRATLFVKGLPGGVREEDVKKVFGAYGPLDRLSVQHPNPSFAYALVVFSSPHFATAALTALSGQYFTSLLPSLPSSSSSSSSSAAYPPSYGTFTRPMVVEYSDPSRKTSAAVEAAKRGVQMAPAQTTKPPVASTSSLASRRASGGGAGGGETGSGMGADGLFRARETPVPASQSQSQCQGQARGGAQPVKAEELSPVKPKVGISGTGEGGEDRPSHPAIALRQALKRPVGPDGGEWGRPEQATDLTAVTKIDPPVVSYQHVPLAVLSSCVRVTGKAGKRRTRYSCSYLLPPSFPFPALNTPAIALPRLDTPEGVRVVGSKYKRQAGKNDPRPAVVVTLQLDKAAILERALFTQRDRIKMARRADAEATERKERAVDPDYEAEEEDDDKDDEMQLDDSGVEADSSRGFADGDGDGDGEDEDDVEEDASDAQDVERMLRPASVASFAQPTPPPPPPPAPAPAPVPAPPRSFSFASPSLPPPVPSTSTSSSALASPAPLQQETDDGFQCARIPLPLDCRGDDPALQGRRAQFLMEKTRKFVEGTFLVLNYFLLDPATAPAASTAAAPAASSSTSTPAPAPTVDSSSSKAPSSSSRPGPPARLTTTSTAERALSNLHIPSPSSSSSTPAVAAPAALQPTPVQQEQQQPLQAQDVEMEDIKPVIPRSQPETTGMDVDVHDDEGDEDEIDQLASPTPEVPAELVRFPLAMNKKSSTNRAAVGNYTRDFLNEYFRRFDSSRASLEAMYTNDALFSLKLLHSVPARSKFPPVAFSRAWQSAALKPFVVSPTAITNLIAQLPPGSTDLNRVIWTAREVDALLPSSTGLTAASGATRRRGTPSAIHLHVKGEFEEFPEKVVRTFSRTFVLVPKPARGVGADGGVVPEYWIRSDQLTVMYHVPGEPRLLPLQPVLFSPPGKAATGQAGSSAIAAAQQRVQPVASTSSSRLSTTAASAAPSPFPSTSALNPVRPFSSSVPSHPASAAAARPLKSTASSDVIVLSDSDADVSARRASTTASTSPVLARRPAPAPAPAPVPAAAAPSSTALGKRRVPPETDDEQQQPQQQQYGAPTSASKGKGRKAQRPRTESTSSAAPPPPSSSTSAGETSAEKAAQLGVSQDELRMLVAEQVRAEFERMASSGVATPDREREREREKGKKGRASLEGRGEKAKEKEKEKVPVKAKEKEKGSSAAAAGKGKDGKKSKEKEGPLLGRQLPAGDARILLAQPPNNQVHGFDGRSNKLRHMIRISPSSHLAVSFLGDIAEFTSVTPDDSGSSTTVKKLHKANGDATFRVDDFAWSEAKETLVVGFLGAKEQGVKELRQPPNQIVLYKREALPNGHSTLHPTLVENKPHQQGGVSAVTVIPGGGRLRFVTAGEDKKMHIWTRQRSTQKVTTDALRCAQHSSTITSLAYLPETNYVVSASKDKRLIAHELTDQSTAWQALLSHPIMTVQQLTTIDPHLILARMGSPKNQFSIHDVRISGMLPPVLSFGIDLAPHRHATNGTMSETNMGRYLRGDLCDTVFAFPDHEYGVKLWDLRNVRSPASSSTSSSSSTNPSSSGIHRTQSLTALCKSKTVQASFNGRSELCLMGQSHFARVGIYG
ncbi:hypothetical protein JCM8097_007032 [Rhodosporidiobolus ruineniae]